MKFLVVGDPHMKPEDLDEGARLIERIKEVVAEVGTDRIVIMGDLFHTHSLVHVEVMHFWQQSVRQLAALCPVYILLGNHDGPHDMKAGVHALTSLRHVHEDVTVIDSPRILDGMLFLPFMRSNEEFVQACIGSTNHMGQTAHTVYCHQEFDGCKYDNGFYAKHGVQPDSIPQKLVVSGHIHSGQEFGKIWYVGAPRWMTASDANQERFVWVIDHNAEGGIVARTAYRTDPACQRIVHLKDTAAEPVDIAALDPKWKVIVDVSGTAAWVKERKDAWVGKARVRTFVEEGKKAVVRESEGIATAFNKYLGGFVSPNGTPRTVLERMATERLPH